MSIDTTRASNSNQDAPSLSSQRAIARSHNGLAVEVDIGDAKVLADLPVARGGSNTGPAPGHLMRASVAACLAIGYKTWAAQLGVALQDVEVELTTDIDMRGQAAATDVPPGWQRMRWHVRVTSNASEAEIERVLAHAERLSPMLDCVHPRCERVRTFERHPANG